MLLEPFFFLCTSVRHAKLTSGLPSGCGDPVHSGRELSSVPSCSTVPDVKGLAYHKAMNTARLICRHHLTYLDELTGRD